MVNFKKPLITIITSSWNREKYLKKLAYSLNKQSFKNFEWIISNDGSTDGTEKFIKSFSKKCNFKITYIHSSLRIGKAKLVNIMLDNLKSKYMVECDSDDYFLPNSLEILIKLINKIPKSIENKFVGVFAQNVDTNGVSQTFKYKIPKSNYDIKYKDLDELADGDGTILFFSKNFKNKRYLEVDYIITESSLLKNIFKGKSFVLTNKIVKIMDRKSINSVSFGKKLEYNRGSAYSMALTIKNIDFKKYNYFKRIKIVINYFRYSFHGDLDFRESINKFSPVKSNNIYLMLLPFVFIICVRDLILNRVKKTHLEFKKNIKKTKIKKFDLARNKVSIIN